MALKGGKGAGKMSFWTRLIKFYLLQIISANNMLDLICFVGFVKFWGLPSHLSWPHPVFTLSVNSLWKSLTLEKWNVWEVRLLTEKAKKTVIDPIPWENGNDRQNVTSRAFIIMVSPLAGSQLMRDSSHKRQFSFYFYPILWYVKRMLLWKEVNKIF